MKEEMTSFDIAAVTSELNQMVKGAYINNIYQTSLRTLLLKLRQPGKPHLHLLIEARKRLHLTSYVLDKPSKPSSFCMALRKYLRNGMIREVEQHRFERIVILRVDTKEGEFQLISELFGRGNIILVNPQNAILHALTYRKMRDRNVIRGEPFQHPPSSGKNPIKLSLQDFTEIKKLGSLEIVRALTKFLSISGLYSEEILLRANIDKTISCASLTPSDVKGIFDQLSHILSIVSSSKAKPCIVVDDDGNWVDVTPFPLKKHTHFEQELYKNFNEALDEYYTETGVDEKVAKFARDADRELKKQQRIIQNQKKTIEDSKTEIEQNKKIGDMIYMHFNDLQFLLRKINDEKRRGKRWEEIMSDIEKQREAGITFAKHLQSMEPQRLMIHVSVEGLVFPLNLRRSVQVNAATYYNKAKKAEKKLKGAEKALRETQARIKELQQKQVEKLRETHRPPPKRRKKAWYEKFRWFYSSDGFLVIGGKDATTNEILIKKHMNPHDVVFHADIHGAPFILIKTEGKPPPERTLKESAQLAASYSRAWKEMLTAVDVYWISPQQVDKSAPSRQYLKKGSFMIHGSKNYVRNVPLKMAVGIKVLEGKLTVVGGPSQAVSKQTNIYVEIVPGEQKSGRLAKKIKQRLAEKAPKTLGKQVLELPVENIQQFIPLGRGRIV